MEMYLCGIVDENFYRYKIRLIFVEYKEIYIFNDLNYSGLQP